MGKHHTRIMNKLEYRAAQNNQAEVNDLNISPKIPRLAPDNDKSYLTT